MIGRQAMLDEIKEQPDLFRGLLKRKTEWTADFVRLFHSSSFKRILFVGNGSPFYAGCTLRYAAEKLLRVNAEAVPAGLFYHHGQFDGSGSLRPDEILLICPAESGHSRGQVDAARRAKAAGIPVVSTTLNPKGVLARESTVILPKPGAHEIAMAATKGQSMAIFMLLLCFLEAARSAGNLSERQYEQYLAACEALPDHVERSIEDTMRWFETNEKRVMDAQSYFLLGYGANYGTVREAALKFYECHQRPTCALELEESLHGPFRALHESDMVFFLSAEEGEEKERMAKLRAALRPYCANRVLIRNGTDPADGDVLSIHSGDMEFVDTIEYLVPLQVLSFLIADRLGIDLSIPLVASLDDTMSPAYRD